MNVTQSNTVALNLLSDERVRELADDKRAEQKALRERYRIALAEADAAKVALDRCSTSLRFIRTNADGR